MTCWGHEVCGHLAVAEAGIDPHGCIAQAWSVADTLRAWQALSPGSEPFSRLPVS